MKLYKLRMVMLKWYVHLFDGGGHTSSLECADYAAAGREIERLKTDGWEDADRLELKNA